MTATVTEQTAARTLPKLLVANLAGKPLPILRTTVAPKDGDTEVHYWYTFRDPSRETGTRWGLQIPRVTEHLPTQITIDGVTIGLTKGRSAASFKEKQAVVSNGKAKEVWVDVVIPEEKRKDVAESTTLQVLPSLISAEHEDTGLRNVTVRVSDNKENGTWNVTVKVNKPRVAASPEARKASFQKRAESTMAELDAIIASMG